MKKIIGLFSLMVALTAAFAVKANDLSQAKQLCENATEQQRQMARAAGYDVDAMCASLRQSESNQQVNNQSSNGAILPRELAGFPLEKTSETQEEAKDVEKVDQELEKFGYDLFAGIPTSDTPVANIPVPANYIVGPGDMIKVQLYGKENSSYELQVGRDGAIQFPELGPINVAGLSYTELKESLTQQINEQIIGVQANITMGELRSMQIFVLGEAFKPGAYTVSSLSTIMNALYVSGGVKEVGSLRNIQLKRNGQLITTLDLYDLLLRGDTRRDRRLQAGDVIFIPSVKKTAAVAGEVVRPAIYEIKNENTLGELVNLAGGLLPSAYPQDARVERVNSQGYKTVVDVNLKSNKGKSTRLQNGDLIKIYPVLEKQENIVTLNGHAYRPGDIAWREGMRVSDVISSANLLKPNANIDFALLVRETDLLKEIETYSINLRQVLSTPKSAADLVLKARDQIIVLNNAEKTKDSESRNALLENIIDLLKRQSSLTSPEKTVAIQGSVKFPGRYPLTSGMSVTDLIQASGGFTEDAYSVVAEVTRQDLSNPEQANVIHMPIDLKQEFLGVVSFKLQPHDTLQIKVTPEYRETAQVSVTGEVKFPGTYTIRRGETLSQLVERVGGFTEFAHVKATVFSREELRKREQKELQKLRDRLQQEIDVQKVEKTSITNKSADYSALDSLVDTLDSTEATGRLVIDLPALLDKEVADIELLNGDKLHIPAFRQEVTVLGEVQVPTSHVHNEKLDFADYIERSGGEKNTADEDSIYIVKADGSLVLPNKSGWLTHGDHQVEPGDTIVVPIDTDRVDQLELWTRVSQVVYQLALGAAAVKSF
ncbi:MAG: SLBB domain-containing protein [Kangiellaceae bacterium]|nr:SLBB domain-containing protein [Kangiellaceae bacterium]